MRYLQYLSFGLLLLGGGCREKKAFDCAKYHRGYFRYHFDLNGKREDMLVYRDEQVQRETHLATGDERVLQVRWISECDYQLNYLRSSRPMDSLMEDIQKAMVLRVHIRGGTDDYYLFEARNNLETKVLRDTIWVDKKDEAPMPVGRKG